MDGERGRLYSASLDAADGSTFLDRGQDDRHQFRLIVAPENGKLKIRITGDLAGFLAFVSGMEKPVATDGDGPSQLEMVAGARLGRDRHLLITSI